MGVDLLVSATWKSSFEFVGACSSAGVVGAVEVWETVVAEEKDIASDESDDDDELAADVFK